MPIQINEKILNGNWNFGWALDFHTVSSVRSPDGSFDTQRTEIGELLYQLKYKFDRSKIEAIAKVAADFLKTRRVYPYLKAIIPVPSNVNRPFQPVHELALSIGQKVNLPVPLEYLIKVKFIEPLKSIEDAASRRSQLKGAFKVRDDRFANKNVLLFDDLFRSGETLMEITDVLKKEGKVLKVFVLTITKTRVRR